MLCRSSYFSRERSRFTGFLLCQGLAVFLSAARAEQPTASSPDIPQSKPSVDGLIPWLLREDQELREIPFSQVVLAATGKRVLAVDSEE